MALPELHPVSEAVVFAHSAQIGATPAAAYARAPFRGKVLKVGVVQSAAVTGTATVGHRGERQRHRRRLAVGDRRRGRNAVHRGSDRGERRQRGRCHLVHPSGATGSATGAFFAVIRRA